MIDRKIESAMLLNFLKSSNRKFKEDCLTINFYINPNGTDSISLLLVVISHFLYRSALSRTSIIMLNSSDHNSHTSLALDFNRNASNVLTLSDMCADGT